MRIFPTVFLPDTNPVLQLNAETVYDFKEAMQLTVAHCELALLELSPSHPAREELGQALTSATLACAICQAWAHLPHVPMSSTAPSIRHAGPWDGPPHSR